MGNELVPRFVKIEPKDSMVEPFSERERLLCEVMFWVSSGKMYPVGIGNLDAFLLEMDIQAREIWKAKDWYKQRCQVLQDEIDMLRKGIR